MKRKIAAVLSMAMLCSACPPAAYAEDWAQLFMQGTQALSQFMTESGLGDAISQHIQEQIQHAPDTMQQIIDGVQQYRQQYEQQNQGASEQNQEEPLVEAIVPEQKQEEPLVELIVPEQKQEEPLVEAIVPEQNQEEPLVEAIVPEQNQEPLVELIVPEQKQEPTVEAIVPVLKQEPMVEAVVPLKKPEITLETPQSEYAEFQMKASVSEGIITVEIKNATDGKMIAIEASGNGIREFNAILTKDGKGSGKIGKIDEQTEEFTALDAGEYTVRAYYESNPSIEKKTTVKVKSAGSSGGSADPVTPPSSGGSTDPIVPPSSGTEQPEVKAFTVFPVVTNGEIAVVIDGASSREVEIVLLDKDGKQAAMSSLIGSGFVQLGRHASGTYSVRAQYVTPAIGADGKPDYKTVTAQVTVPAGVTADPAPSAPVDIKAKVEKGKDYIIVTVTEAADAEMIVSVEGRGDKSIYKGGSVRFDGLEAGKTYGVEIDYVLYIEGAKRYSESVTIDALPVLSAIEITSVTAGENKLTIKGRAQAGKQVIVGADPAGVQAEVLLVNADGTFEANLAANPGTYTSVGACYVADMLKAAIKTGSWVVTAPVVKPSLSVDTVDATSTTVIAKTAAGVIAELKTVDYSQKVMADANGILRFSLPHAYGAGTKMTLTVYYGANQSFTHEITVAVPAYSGTLSYGWEGEEVRKLTARLAALGYPVKETSRYGSTVREAVRLFQLANGLYADGVAVPETQRAIYSLSAIPYGSGRYPTLVRGDKGLSLIYTLQQRLKDLGYYTIKVDGIFGSGTQRAVRLFQQVNGLNVTGKADNATQTLLYSASAKPASYGVSGDYSTLSRSGKYKSKVVPLQRRLKALGYYSGSVDGYFGSQTYRAVRNFQSRNGLTVTGVADPYTQQVLYSAAARPASGSSSSSSSSSGTSTSTGYRLLYWGCRGEAVTKLQQALINAGYKSIVRKADGIYGQWTYDAVRAYQKANGLAVDGIAGKNTQNALYGTNY